MSGMKIDLKGWKKIKGDDKSTTMQHEDGHTITVSHAPLSKSNRAALQALDSMNQTSNNPKLQQSKLTPTNEATYDSKMAKGGRVMLAAGYRPGFSKYNSSHPQAESTPPPSNQIGSGNDASDFSKGASEGSVPQSSPDTSTQGMAKGGKVMNPGVDPRMMAGGGDPSESTEDSPDQIATDAAAAQPQAHAPVTINIGAGAAPQQQPFLTRAGQVLGTGIKDAGQAMGTVLGAPIKGAGQVLSGVGQGLGLRGPDQQTQPADQGSTAPQTQDGSSAAAPQAAASQDPNAQQSAAAPQPSVDANGQPVSTTAAPVQTVPPPQPINPKFTTLPPQAQPIAQAHYDNALKEYTQEDQNAQHDMAMGHIKPQTMQDLFEKHSDGTERGTLSKIGMVFGLMAGGAGAGLAHQAPAMLGAMHQQIQNDLEAQKANVANKQNFYNMQTQRLTAQANAGQTNIDTKAKATALSNMIMNRAALHDQVMKVQAMPPGSPQRQQAEQALAMMSQSVNNENYTIADRAAANEAYLHALQGPQGGGTPKDFDGQVQQQINTLRVINPDKAKEIESRYIPGVGVAAVPVSEQARSQVIAMQDFKNQMTNLYNWAQKHSGESKLTNPTDVNTGRAMAQAAQNSYRTAQDMGVYKASEAPLLEGEISANPTKFFNKYRVLPQYKAVLENNDRKLGTMTKAYGFQGPANAPQQQTPTGPQYKTSGGVTYMRGPTGEAIPVPKGK